MELRGDSIPNSLRTSLISSIGDISKIFKIFLCIFYTIIGILGENAQYSSFTNFLEIGFSCTSICQQSVQIDGLFERFVEHQSALFDDVLNMIMEE